MTRQQKHRYEMFVRVRDFGAANDALFPSPSTGGQAFERVAAAVAAIDGHLTSRVVARAEARKVKAGTRAAVVEAMKTIAATGRRAVRREAGIGAFRMPRNWSNKALIDAARALAGEARKREAEFVRLGLPPTFISDFDTLVNVLEQAVVTRLNSAHLRRRDQAGIASALNQGFDDIGELDVVVPNALRDDPVRLAQWQRARRIDGRSSSTTSPVVAAPPVVVPPPVAAPPEPSSIDPPVAETTGTDEAESREEVAAASDAGAALPKAS